MLTTICLLTGLTFSVFYLLCFWFVRGYPIDLGFRRFNLGMVSIIAGVSLVVLENTAQPQDLKIVGLVWLSSLLGVSFYHWRKRDINVWLVTIPSTIGIYVLMLFQGQFVTVDEKVIVATSLGGLISCCAIFSMILGHWYLNVHGLPISCLMRSVNIFWTLLFLRLGWDFYHIMTAQVMYIGETISLHAFFTSLDGVLLWMAIFFGAIFPVVLLYFVRETLKVKSTQSATGILYVIVISILMGEPVYKYYLVKFQLPL